LGRVFFYFAFTFTFIYCPFILSTRVISQWRKLQNHDTGRSLSMKDCTARYSRMCDSSTLVTRSETIVIQDAISGTPAIEAIN
jgi:hypothetical protein